MDANEIRKIIKENRYKYYGLRCGDNGAEIGEYLKNSRDWVDSEYKLKDYLIDDSCSRFSYLVHMYDNGELHGVCCVRIQDNNIEELIKKVEKKYSKFGRLVLIGGYDYKISIKDGEIIMIGAKRLL